jgi:type II secretory pathway component PulJ
MNETTEKIRTELCAQKIRLIKELRREVAELRRDLNQIMARRKEAF